MRKEWEPGSTQLPSRSGHSGEAHAAGISTWVKIHPAACPAELIEVVELLRTDVDAWKIGGRLPGEPQPKAIDGQRPFFVDADTALAYLRRLVERGLSDKLHRTDEMKVWSPGENDAPESDEAPKDQD